MSIQPIITFKAGVCDLNSNHKVKPKDTPGYVYLYEEDGMLHFCWRPRDQPVNQPELDLLMIPGDASFMPYVGEDDDTENVRSPTSGRICVLKFNSSSQRYLFWLQSKSQHPSGDPSCFSERDLKIQNIVDMLLAGEEIDVQAELESLRNLPRGPRRDGDDDETMEDVEGTNHSQGHHGGGAGGAGPDATGGDYREEGEEAREGGADGARAAAAGTTDAQQAVQNFLNSLRGAGLGGQEAGGDEFTTLMDLLSPNITIPVIDRAPASLINSLCSHLPPMILLLAQEIDDVAEVDPTSETAQAAIEALDQDSKKDVLKRVLNSPQMRQSLASLTVALRDGGLPNVSQALKIDVANGGYIRGGAMPIGGGDAVKAFLEGVKKTVQREAEGEEMDTS
ncbi:uncharacterized protein EI97DRAFT_484835 [Westerdykella ornata]|uniref:Pru domain-containing protein n=1 Tax=Westerdykella ornata TaxID=318751 RepID=A0A6A6JVG7_WESOR|nr:uncharacterized protein EI97DRAFT_484835 [Westerdykella ornata]KAF2279039.1 hypothetical protein EI97DRAFT_484835 [Westerdykella ornata]